MTTIQTRPSSNYQPSWYELEGTVNTRDVGGLPARDGMVVRPGRLLRSDSVHAVTPVDVIQLTEHYGLRTVLDLRTQRESDLDGVGPLAAAGVRRLDAPFVNGRALNPVKDTSKPAYLDYRTLTAIAADSLAQSLTALSEPGALPALVHCSAGKDRTGIVVALVLDLIGVDREAIIADYLATADRLEEVLARTAALPSRLDNPIDPRSHLLNAEAIQEVFDLVDAAGGSGAWLFASGAPADLAERFAADLLISAP
jgi:protein-tyrosine phosphatase